MKSTGHARRLILVVSMGLQLVVAGFSACGRRSLVAISGEAGGCIENPDSCGRKEVCDRYYNACTPAAVYDIDGGTVDGGLNDGSTISSTGGTGTSSSTGGNSASDTDITSSTSGLTTGITTDGSSLTSSTDSTAGSSYTDSSSSTDSSSATDGSGSSDSSGDSSGGDSGGGDSGGGDSGGGCERPRPAMPHLGSTSLGGRKAHQ